VNKENKMANNGIQKSADKLWHKPVCGYIGPVCSRATQTDKNKKELKNKENFYNAGFKQQ
jgi:hypothetical protein